jgi:hypothetical protein
MTQDEIAPGARFSNQDGHMPEDAEYLIKLEAQ